MLKKRVRVFFGGDVSVFVDRREKGDEWVDWVSFVFVALGNRDFGYNM